MKPIVEYLINRQTKDIRQTIIKNITNELYRKFKKYDEFKHIKETGEICITYAYEGDEEEFRKIFPKEVFDKARYEKDDNSEYYGYWFFEIADIVDYFLSHNKTERQMLATIVEWFSFL